jgi:ribosomal protein S18 acetylase RimI-like enzyme
LKITFRNADINDIELTIDLQNKSFFQDYVQYGTCPSYNRTKEKMLNIINNHFDFIIYADNLPVGNMVVKIKGDNECHLNSIGIIPEYQKNGIGKIAMKFLESNFSHCKLFTLDTPFDKKQNISFYEKCGYKVIGEDNSSNVKCLLFEKRIL